MGVLQGTHDLKRVVLIVGTRRITGFGETDAVTIVTDENRYNKKVGADGQTTRSRTNNDADSVTITVHQTNIEAIKYLDSIAKLPSPLDVVPISITSLNTLEKYASPQCWLQKDPDVSFHKDSGDRVYVFDTAGGTKL